MRVEFAAYEVAGFLQACVAKPRRCEVLCTAIRVLTCGDVGFLFNAIALVENAEFHLFKWLRARRAYDAVVAFWIDKEFKDG